MYSLIERYMNKITKEDVNSFALKKNITLSDDELTFTYDFIKKNWDKILSNPNILNLNRYKDKYSEENLLEKVIEFSHEIIYNPNIVDNKYDEETYNAIMVSEKSYLETIKEDKARYASKRLFDILNEDDDDYISIVSKEYYDIVSNTIREDLVNTYNNLIFS